MINIGLYYFPNLANNNINNLYKFCFVSSILLSLGFISSFLPVLSNDPFRYVMLGLFVFTVIDSICLSKRKKALENVKTAEKYLIHREQIHYPQMIAILSKACKYNFPRAQNLLSTCYSLGLGVKKNLKLAFELVKKSIGQDDPEAMTVLGICYLTKPNAKEDELREGFSLVKQAAHLGYPKAITHLGVCYLKGLGTKVDTEQAIVCLSKASDEGEKNAMYHLSNCYLNGIGVALNIQKASELYESSLQEVNSEALFMTSESRMPERALDDIDDQPLSTWEDGIHAFRKTLEDYNRSTNQTFRNSKPTPWTLTTPESEVRYQQYLQMQANEAEAEALRTEVENKEREELLAKLKASRSIVNDSQQRDKFLPKIISLSNDLEFQKAFNNCKSEDEIVTCLNRFHIQEDGISFIDEGFLSGISFSDEALDFLFGNPLKNIRGIWEKADQNEQEATLDQILEAIGKKIGNENLIRIFWNREKRYEPACHQSEENLLWYHYRKQWEMIVQAFKPVTEMI